jgi:thiamine biosynthesis protein ThiS
MAVATIGVTINGKPEDVQAGTTIARLLELRQLHTALVAVEHNGQILRRDDFAEVAIAPGDKLEIVHFVGGG